LIWLLPFRFSEHFEQNQDEGQVAQVDRSIQYVAACADEFLLCFRVLLLPNFQSKLPSFLIHLYKCVLRGLFATLCLAEARALKSPKGKLQP
jgi:hypothetical protein